MMRMLGVVSALCAIAACGSDDGMVGPGTPGTVAAVTLSPPQATVELPGQTLTVTARATDQSGTALSDQTWTWMSADPDVATVDAQGQVTAIGIGTTTLTATTAGVSGNLTFQVSGPTSISFLGGTWTVTRSDGLTATTQFVTLTGGIREEIRSRDGTEILRALTRVDGSSWLYGRADAERRRMQFFKGRFVAGQSETVATTPDGTARLVLQDVSTQGFTIRLQAASGSQWVDEVTESYSR